MSEADKLFEESGYKKYDNHPEQDYPPEPNMWTTQDERIIEYVEYGEARGYPGKEIIRFYPNGKFVTVSAFVGDRQVEAPLNMQELKAINMKCRELGWSEE